VDLGLELTDDESKMEAKAADVGANAGVVVVAFDFGTKSTAGEFLTLCQDWR
jgi:uncharacterized protein YbjQ (UPF0145 family)